MTRSRASRFNVGATSEIDLAKLTVAEKDALILSRLPLVGQLEAAAARIAELEAWLARLEKPRKTRDSYSLPPGGEWAPMFEMLAEQVASAPPVRPTPLTHDALLGLFKGEAVGRNVVLQAATEADMCAATVLNKPTLEVVYEGA